MPPRLAVDWRSLPICQTLDPFRCRPDRTASQPLRTWCICTMVYLSTCRPSCGDGCAAAKARAATT